MAGSWLGLSLGLCFLRWPAKRLIPWFLDSMSVAVQSWVSAVFPMKTVPQFIGKLSLIPETRKRFRMLSGCCPDAVGKEPDHIGRQSWSSPAPLLKSVKEQSYLPAAANNFLTRLFFFFYNQNWHILSCFFLMNRKELNRTAADRAMAQIRLVFAYIPGLFQPFTKE